jgi:hypothetical protein
MVHFKCMNRFGGAVLAAAFMFALPLAASAQSRESRRFTIPSDETRDGSVPYRPSLSVEERERELRMESLEKCRLLAGIGERTLLDDIVGFPNVLIDWTARAINPPAPMGEAYSLRACDDGSVLNRVFASSIQDASTRPFNDLFEQLLLREQRYFARFQDTDLSTVGVEDGVEDIDSAGLMAAQRKLLFDTARKMYFGRLGSKADDRLRDESLDISRWEPIDYAVAPALLAGYLYVRGWEKKFELAGLNWNFQIEPLRRILGRNGDESDDLVSAASFEIGVGDFPVKAILSFGYQDGDALMDFVGFGTSVGKAKQIVSAELGAENEID